MADIELVIKIPEEACNLILGRIDTANIDLYSTLIQAVRNGRQLPKGHGRLIDVSNILTVTEINSDGSEHTYVQYSEIEETQTIIEADMESK